MKKSIKIKKPRVWEIDFFRGFAILLVVWDHAMVDLAMFHYTWKTLGVNWLTEWGLFGIEYLYSDIRLFWRPVFLFIFFFASGISTAFSKNNFIRGIRLAVVSLAVSLITYALSYFTGDEYFILFGVLHCISVIILIYTLLVFLIEKAIKLITIISKQNYNEKLSKTIISVICIVLGIVFYFINHKYNISLHETDLNKMFVSTDSKWLGLFFYARNWSTADYFPLFPFISFFFLGAGLTRFLYPQKKSLFPSLDGKWNKIFTVSGKYSLIIYLAIQVVVFALLALLTFIATGEFLL